MEDLDKDTRFNVKLQIELYNLAKKVMSDEKKEDFLEYMEGRKEKLRKILNMDHGKIYENGEVIFTL